MKPLKKHFEASEENVHVKIQGEIYRCANLKKSGTLNKTTILLAHEDVWHEVNCLDLGGDDSNLHNFKYHIENHDYKLSDLGVKTTKSEIPKSFELTHNDFIELDAKYGFSHVYISKLVDFFKETKQKTGKYNVESTLTYLKQKGHTIQEYINNEKKQANEIINNSNKIIKMEGNKTLQSERIEYLQSLGFNWEEKESSYVCRYGSAESPACFMVSIKSIESYVSEDWDKLVERIEFNVPGAGDTTHDLTGQTAEAYFTTDDPGNTQEPSLNDGDTKPETLLAIPVTEEKKPVSLTVIGNLTPERIKEFASMKANQEKIVKDNPYIKPTDAVTLKKAKVHAAALLKASTAIDGKTGIKAAKNKYLKQLNTVLDTFLDSMTGLTRTAYDKQKLANDAFESAEALRIQNEKKAELEKISERTSKLFAVPMVFNGQNYNIGTLYILPSQITSATDEEFAALVTQAKGIKAGLDAAEEANKAKDKLIEELTARLAKLEGKEEPATEPAETSKVSQPTNTVPISKTVTNNANLTNNAANQPNAQPSKKTEPTGSVPNTSSDLVYTKPKESNRIVLAFDLENLQHVEKQAFLKCRNYYIRGTQDVAKELQRIFASDHPKKSEAIKELIDSLL